MSHRGIIDLTGNKRIRDTIDLTGDDEEVQLSESSNRRRLNADAGLPSLKDLVDNEKGYAVIPFPVEILNNFKVNEFLLGQKEFKNQDVNQLFVLGGFGAMGNPSSFHHPMRRALMQAIYEYMVPIFANVIRGSGLEYRYLSMIPDRFGIRRNDQQVGDESWHKDQSLDKERSRHAIVFGGWMNLDPIDSGKIQYFSYAEGEVVPLNQTEDFYKANADRKGGFSAEAGRMYNRRRIAIPPGHLVIFNELLTHEVAKGENKKAFDPSKTSYRCYLKWFLSKNESPYWPIYRLNNFFNNQTQIGMSIYQPDAPFYSSNHSSTSTDPLLYISDRVIDEVKGFEIKGEKKQLSNMAYRFMGQGQKTKPNENFERQGLVNWGLAFNAYSPAEKRMYQVPLLLQ
jgi:hypothetical protein